MTETPSILAIIPARGGSKRLPGKNLRKLGGHSLLGWTIEAARNAEAIDRIVVSSEDPQIISAAIACGAEVPFIRPSQLATDTADSLDVIRHALEAAGEFFDMFVVLQPTSPLRRSADIDEAVRLCLEKRAPACVSVTPSDKPPRWMYRVLPNASVMPLLTKDLDDTNIVIPNGAIYLAQTEWFRQNQVLISPETVAYVMPPERSVDIDDPLDLILAEALLTAQQQPAATETTPLQAEFA